MVPSPHELYYKLNHIVVHASWKRIWWRFWVTSKHGTRASLMSGISMKGDSPLKKYFLSQGILHQINTNARRKGDVNHLELTLMRGCKWDCVGLSPRVESLLLDASVISKWEIYYVTNLPSNLQIIPSHQFCTIRMRR